MTQQSSARDAASREGTAREPLLELYDALAQYQLRDAGAEVAAAIAHAVGTPLNVISGRAELIRHDPSNALAQVARIEEQVKKLATGLRQLVDYLAVPDPRVPLRPAPVSRRTPADGTPPEARGVAPARGPNSAQLATDGGDAAHPGREPSIEAPSDVVVDARTVLDDALALTAAVARSNRVEVVAEGEALKGARVERWHALGTLSTLVSSAVRHAGSQAASKLKKGESGHPNPAHASPPRIRIGAALGAQGVLYELVVPGLTVIEGWQLEHFQARPAVTESSEFYRTMSICAAVVRGHGGKLLLESAPTADAIVIRFSCRNEAAS